MNIDDHDVDQDMGIEEENTAQETISEDLSHISEKLIDIKNHAVDYVKQNPMKAIGISLLTGVVLAQLLRLRKK
jgi:ElaB/YqjD/DUF883 family membrane-anchored ribosome-binding protein